MTIKRKPDDKRLQIKKPEPFDLKKARKEVLRTIEENKEWVREMAKK